MFVRLPYRVTENAFHISCTLTLSGPESWISDQLSWVLSSVCSTVKEDLQTSPAELLYCQVLVFPGGDYFPALQQPSAVWNFSNSSATTLSEQHLYTATQAPEAMPPSQPLPSATRYVFICKGGVKQFLAQLYIRSFICQEQSSPSKWVTIGGAGRRKKGAKRQL